MVSGAGTLLLKVQSMFFIAAAVGLFVTEV